jgi:general secretion pathway protein K
VSRRRERGVALFAAVSALAVLSVVAVGLARTTIVDQRLTTNALAALQADALARSGVAIAAALVDETSGLPDTLRSPWARSTGPQALGSGWVEVRVEDEARRLDLNDPALAAAVPRLLATLALDPALADALADWTDDDDLPRAHGGERDWYLTRAVPSLPANGPLASIGELGRVRGFDAETVARLRPFVTVAGEATVNPNTAPREVLLALLGDAAAVDGVLAARARGALTTEALPALVPNADARRLLAPRSQHYTVRAVAAVGEVRRAVEATLSAPGAGEPQVVAWRAVVPDDGPLR